MLSRNIIVGLLSFLTLIDLFGSQAILPQLTRAFDTDPASMGLAVNASTLGMAAAGLAVALFSRHIDRVRGIWLSLAFLAIPTTLLGVVDDLTLFTWLRVAQGALMATAFTLTMSYLAEECSAAEAAGAMAGYITGNVLSNLVGRLMAANFADWFGLSVSFWLFAVLNLAGALLAYLCLGQATARQADPNGPSVMEVWKIHLTNPRLQASFGLGFLILFIFLSVFTYVNFVLSAQPFGLTGPQLGMVYFVFLPAVFTTPLAGKMVATRGVYFAFLMSMGLAAAGLLALLTSSLVLLVAGLAAIGVGTFCAQAVVSGQIGAAATADRATASGLYLTSYYLGGLLGTAIIGTVFTAAGWAPVVYLLLLITLFSMIAAWPLRRAEPVAST
ncbi:MFS transporter [uncultured Tateyamaria sp.]|uniref:MFS transporter n=1 Tax=uncultured Tateyamaria sp. TaxID=455651 RepID=UPI00261F2145|nr:MFS transporter [uncultured Tateyamaria sp.]